MNKPYIIIFDYSTLEKDLIETFIEAIRSTYVSKKINDNIFVVASTETDPELVYVGIHKKLNQKVNFLVVGFDNFYGNISVDIEWFKETFPSVELTTSKDGPISK